MHARVIINLQAGHGAGGREVNLLAENLPGEEHSTCIGNAIAAALGKRRAFGLNVKAEF